jgi:hypothetical protein
MPSVVAPLLLLLLLLRLTMAMASIPVYRRNIVKWFARLREQAWRRIEQN